MKRWKAQINLGGKLTTVEFETDGKPVEYLWEKFGISTYISTLIEIETETETEDE